MTSSIPPPRGAVASTDLATVCAPGCSRWVRPPAAHTDAAKARQLAAGYPGATGLGAADVEEDHPVIALGGDPRSAQNRWPQPRHIRDRDSRDVGAPAKDGLEGWLYDQVCHRHTVPLARTQDELATDWYAAWLAARRRTSRWPARPASGPGARSAGGTPGR